MKIAEHGWAVLTVVAKNCFSNNLRVVRKFSTIEIQIYLIDMVLGRDVFCKQP